MAAVEICIRCDDVDNVRRDVAAALAGGAARVELCGRMEVGGLTPDGDLVREARAAFDRPGALVMVRPRAGDFVYGAGEVRAMEEQIHRAVALGADGVVVGCLRAGGLDPEAMAVLVEAARAGGLAVSMHRAFDDAVDPLAALEQAIELRVDRILTSGTPWTGGGSALDGLDRLREIATAAAGRVEVVVGGGVAPGNAGQILSALPDGARTSLHAFSGVQAGGRVRAELVAALVRADA